MTGRARVLVRPQTVKNLKPTRAHASSCGIQSAHPPSVHALAAIIIGYGTHVQHKRQIREIQAKKAVELAAAPGTMA